MSQPVLEPLSPDILRLLAVEKSRPGPSDAMQARVLARIGEDLLANIPLSAGTGAQSLLATRPRPRLPVNLRRIPLAVGLLALGGLGGAGLHALLTKPHARPNTSPVTAPTTVPALPAQPMPAPVTDAAPPAKAETRRNAPAVRRSVQAAEPSMPAGEAREPLGRDGELAAERALLEQARMALARGKPVDAMALLARHDREFRQGRLSEEREALLILSLVADRKVDEAREQARRFKEKYPKSMLLRTIDAAVQSGR